MYQNMDEEHCVIAILTLNLRDSATADKRCYTSLLYVLPFSLNDDAKIQIKIKTAK